MTTTKRRAKEGLAKTAEHYLKAPYARVLLPDRDGGYTAEILEFPGCIAEGDTGEEALRNLESAAASWIEAQLEQGQSIPEPTDVSSFSGRVALRLPRTLHRQASRFAQRDGTSLNQFVVSAVAARIGADDLIDRLAEKWTASRVNVVRTGPVSIQTNVSITSFVVGTATVLPLHGELSQFSVWGSGPSVTNQTTAGALTGASRGR